MVRVLNSLMEALRLDQSSFERLVAKVMSVPARRFMRSNNKELTGFPVGQIVGRLNDVRTTKDVMFDMVEEWISTTERLNGLLG